MRKLITQIVCCIACALITAPQAHAEEAQGSLPSPQQVEVLIRKARGGDVQSQFLLARAFEAGHGTARSYSEAVRWYTAAANQGLAVAQFSLAMIYEEGRPGVARNFPYAISWYEEAARNGLKIALDRLHALIGAATASNIQ